MLDLVNFSVIHNLMIETNGLYRGRVSFAAGNRADQQPFTPANETLPLCNIKTTDNTIYLPNADELRQ